MVAVTNIANDLYAKDISKKISSSKQEAMEKGIPTGNVAYGYKVVFNENKVKVMVEDKEPADVVRWIFNRGRKSYTAFCDSGRTECEAYPYTCPVQSKGII